MLGKIGEIGRDGGRSASSGEAIRRSVCCGSVDLLTIADQTVVVGFLDPLVDNGARPVRGHIITEDGGLVVECARLGCVAARLREENGDVVVGNIFGERIVARDSVRGLTTPLVGIEREEIEGLGRVVTASHVILKHWSETGNIGGGITDRNAPVAFRVAVRLGVASSCLYEWRGYRSIAFWKKRKVSKKKEQCLMTRGSTWEKNKENTYQSSKPHCRRRNQRHCRTAGTRP